MTRVFLLLACSDLCEGKCDSMDVFWILLTTVFFGVTLLALRWIDSLREES